MMKDDKRSSPALWLAKLQPEESNLINSRKRREIVKKLRENQIIKGMIRNERKD